MKTITIENFVGKMNADVFVHIAAPPKEMKTSKDFPIRVMVQVENDETVRFEADIVNLVRFTCYTAPTVLCLMSHGLEPDSFVKWYVQNVEDASKEDELCAYIFKKVG